MYNQAYRPIPFFVGVTKSKKHAALSAFTLDLSVNEDSLVIIYHNTFINLACINCS